MRTTVTFEGNLDEDSQVWFTGSGKQITEITVLVSQCRLDGNGQCVDGEPIRRPSALLPHWVRTSRMSSTSVLVNTFARGLRVLLSWPAGWRRVQVPGGPRC
jgi:hypothetical protein